jgi:GNAT superfamily N-acetyltransferase
MWRIAASSDDEAIVRMCLAFNAEDPGPNPVPAVHVQRTLRALRENPERGRAIVLELGSRANGYAFVISYWSNELGGGVDVLDEIYVEPEHRKRGYGRTLIETLASRTPPLGSDVVALTLEVTPDNARARRLYESLGFQGRNLGMRRLLPR